MEDLWTGARGKMWGFPLFRFWCHSLSLWGNDEGSYTVSEYAMGYSQLLSSSHKTLHLQKLCVCWEVINNIAISSWLTIFTQAGSTTWETLCSYVCTSSLQSSKDSSWPPYLESVMRLLASSKNVEVHWVTINNYCQFPVHYVILWIFLCLR